ncbi:MAG: hypothetical protein ACFFEA_07755 [Candidatus Thorarchaeota archaeon]
MESEVDVTIIGEGPAGLAAAKNFADSDVSLPWPYQPMQKWNESSESD